MRELEMQLSKAEEKERSGAEDLIFDHENAIEELKEAHQTALQHHISTEMDRVTQQHQIRHDKEMEVVRELEMQLSKAEEKERSGAEDLIFDHENAIEELKEAHQTALQHHVATEIDRVTQHHQIRHDKEMEVVRELEMQLSKSRGEREKWCREVNIRSRKCDRGTERSSSTPRLDGDRSNEQTSLR